MGQSIQKMDQVKFVEDSLRKVWSDMVCLSRPYNFNFFKGCLPQISLGPFLNTLPHIFISNVSNVFLQSISRLIWWIEQQALQEMKNFSQYHEASKQNRMTLLMMFIHFQMSSDLRIMKSPLKIFKWLKIGQKLPKTNQVLILNHFTVDCRRGRYNGNI